MEKSLSKIQVIVAILATLYVVMPDLFVGPFDDAALATMAIIVEASLGIMKAIMHSCDGLISHFDDDFF
ncbi:MAG: hypothetical protein K6A80_08745 [Saccharofermentans sp.]|nr:hypothetical protein [Saccharofermentans sp.]